jgi:hypothetical protein
VSPRNPLYRKYGTRFGHAHLERQTCSEVSESPAIPTWTRQRMKNFRYRFAAVLRRAIEPMERGEYAAICAPGAGW